MVNIIISQQACTGGLVFCVLIIALGKLLIIMDAYLHPATITINKRTILLAILNLMYSSMLASSVVGTL